MSVNHVRVWPRAYQAEGVFLCLVCSKNREGSLAKRIVVGDEVRVLGRNKLFRALQAIIIFCLFVLTFREMGSCWITSEERNSSH